MAEVLGTNLIVSPSPVETWSGFPSIEELRERLEEMGIFAESQVLALRESGEHRLLRVRTPAASVEDAVLWLDRALQERFSAWSGPDWFVWLRLLLLGLQPRLPVEHRSLEAAGRIPTAPEDYRNGIGPEHVHYDIHETERGSELIVQVHPRVCAQFLGIENRKCRSVEENPGAAELEGPWLGLAAWPRRLVAESLSRFEELRELGYSVHWTTTKCRPRRREIFLVRWPGAELQDFASELLSRAQRIGGLSWLEEIDFDRWFPRTPILPCSRKQLDRIMDEISEPSEPLRASWVHRLGTQRVLLAGVLHAQRRRSAGGRCAAIASPSRSRASRWRGYWQSGV